MTTRAFRFQADVNSDGIFTTGLIYDQVMTVDPVTDELVGGALIGPTIVTDETHPGLFDALNAQADEIDVRVQTQRAKYAAAKVALADAVVADE